MAIVKPFKGLRPPKEIVEKLACLPYDVMNSKEAAEMAKGKDCSLLHITKAEIDCDPNVDVHSETVYNKAVENFNKFQEKNWLIQDPEPRFYIYAQTMEGRTQYGIVGGASCTDYFEGKIKKHELTRPDKEEDRMQLTIYTNANIEPVFFTYKANHKIDEIVNEVVNSQKPDYDFVAEDNFGHHFWVIYDQDKNKKIEEIFRNEVPHVYVADGHHRTAAAARIGKERAEKNPNHTGNEEYNFFMAVFFPDNQLEIIDYNRTVKDLNGLTKEQLLEKLNNDFEVTLMGHDIFKPSKLHEFSMYLDGVWYKLNTKAGRFNDNDPLEVLDVTILSNLILYKILGIDDLRRSNRIDFIGGIRGVGELKKRVDSGDMAVAFALYPVTMQQLINIADTGNIMPPKTTWFEPKLRSGLVIHKLD